jgi:hypothetical protein
MKLTRVHGDAHLLLPTHHLCHPRPCTTSTAPARSCLMLLQLLMLLTPWHRNDTDALVGYAEANAELARLTRRHGGDAAQVSEHLQQALGAYNNALRQSSKLGRLEDRWGAAAW